MKLHLAVRDSTGQMGNGFSEGRCDSRGWACGLLVLSH